jgi:hypothetical protein
MHSSRRSKAVYLKGEALVAALLLTDLPVKLLRDGKASRHVSASAALSLAKAGNCVGKARSDGRRVFHIRELPAIPAPERDDSFLWGMPVLRQCRDIVAAARASYVQDAVAVENLRRFRRRDMLVAIASYPNQRWVD